MSLECYPYSSEMRELTGRLKRADISRELDARVERDGVSVVAGALNSSSFRVERASFRVAGGGMIGAACSTAWR